MSRSPRRLLRRAADALRELQDVSARHPEAHADLARVLSDAGVEELARAARVVTAAADIVDARGPE